MNLNKSETKMKETFRHCNAIVTDCVKELVHLNGGKPPNAFSLSGEGWEIAEKSIEGTAFKGSLYNDTTRLCDEYTERVARYCHAWVDRYRTATSARAQKTQEQ